MYGRFIAVRFIAAGFAIALVGACHEPGVVSTSYSFDDSANKDEALVLFGIKASSPTSRDVGLLGVIFQRYDPQTDRLVADARPIWLSGTRCKPFGECDEFVHARYQVFHVPTGTYALTTLWTFISAKPFTRPAYHMTSLVGLELHQGLLGSTTIQIPRDAIVGRAPRYYFGKGEVIYLGEFIIDAVDFPARLVSIERDDNAAETARQRFVNIQNAPLVFRLPNDRAGQPTRIENLQGVMSDPGDQAIMPTPR